MGVRWLVDGMNVIGSRPDGWWKDRHAAMVRLVEQLERWAGEDDEVTVVFEKPPSPPISSAVVEVAHAPRGGANAADREIVRRLAAEAEPATFSVVTSDDWLAGRARAVGAEVVRARAFRRRLDSA